MENKATVYNDITFLQLCSVQVYYGLLYSGFCAYSLYNPYWQYPDYVGWHNSPRGYYYKGQTADSRQQAADSRQ